MKSGKSKLGTSISVALLSVLFLFGVTSPALASASLGSSITTTENELEGPQRSVASPDGRIQAIPSSTNDTVIFAFVASHTRVTVSDPHRYIREPLSVAFSPDGSKLYVANYSADVAVIDVATRTAVSEFRTHNGENVGIAVSPDGRTIVVTDDYSDVTSYDVTHSYAELHNADTSDGFQIGVFFTSANSVLLVSNDGVIDRFNPLNGTMTPVGTSELNSKASCMNSDFSLLAGSDGNKAILINPATGATIAFHIEGGASRLKNCLFTENGQLIFTDSNVGDRGAGGKVFIYETSVSSLAPITSITFTDVEFTDGISIMRNCEVFADGWYTNIGVFSLSTDWCSPRSDPAPTASLANTGTNSGSLTATVLASFCFLLIGATIATTSRRKLRR